MGTTGGGDSGGVVGDGGDDGVEGADEVVRQLGAVVPERGGEGGGGGGGAAEVDDELGEDAVSNAEVSLSSDQTLERPVAGVLRAQVRRVPPSWLCSASRPDANTQSALASLPAQPAAEKVSGQGCIVPESGGDSGHRQQQSGGDDAVMRRLAELRPRRPAAVAMPERRITSRAPLRHCESESDQNRTERELQLGSEKLWLPLQTSDLAGYKF